MYAMNLEQKTKKGPVKGGGRKPLSSLEETVLIGFKAKRSTKVRLDIASKKLGYSEISFLLRTVIEAWLKQFDKANN